MKLFEKWKRTQDEPRKIIAFGSSNTELTWANQGWHNWVDWLSITMRDHIGKHVHVLNQGVGGDTTEDLLRRADRDVFSYRPDLVIITIGGNDAIRGMDRERYRSLLKEICETTTASGSVPILQTYYCPLYDESEDGFRERFEANMESVRQTADELGLLLVDQYRRFEPLYRSAPDTYARIMRDWIHLNAAGNFMMGQYLCSVLGLPGLPVPQLLREISGIPDEWLS